MANGDKTVAGVRDRFRRAASWRTHFNQQLTKLTLHRVESFDFFDDAGARASQKDCADGIFSFPWTIETAVDRDSGPGAVRIDVVSVSEHWSDACACRSKCRIGKPGTAG